MPAKVYHKGAKACATSRDDWETPPALFALLDAEFGFTLDVCATIGNAKGKDKKFFCPPGQDSTLLYPRCMGMDGLAQSWQGHTCWLNPPYSATKEWLRKAEVEGGNTSVVCLVAARTDTIIWHEVVWPHASEIRFLKGRLRFVGATAGAPFPSAVVVFRPGASHYRQQVRGWDWRTEAKEAKTDG